MSEHSAKFSDAAKLLVESLRTNKRLCVLFGLIETLAAWLLPKEWCALASVLATISFVHLAFYIWCDSSDYMVTSARHAYNENISLTTCCLFMSTANYFPRCVLVDGLTSVAVPVILLMNATSTNRVLFICSATSAAQAFQLMGSALHQTDKIQWGALTVIIQAMMIQVCRKNKAVNDTCTKLESVYHTLQRTMGSMCDGFFVLDGYGRVLGMDQRASSIIRPHHSPMDPVTFDSLLKQSSCDENGIALGLRRSRLKSHDGQCLEVESYTSSCILSRADFHFILGGPYSPNKGEHEAYAPLFPSSSASSSAECLYLRAVRVIAQVGDDAADVPSPHDVVKRPSFEAPFAEPVQSNVGQAQGLTADDAVLQTDRSDEHSRVESRVADRFLSEGQSSACSQTSTELSTARSKTSTRNRSIGYRMDALLNFMLHPPDEILEKSPDPPAFRQHLLQTGRHTRRLLKNILAQTCEQLPEIRLDSLPETME